MTREIHERILITGATSGSSHLPKTYRDARFAYDGATTTSTLDAALTRLEREYGVDARDLLFEPDDDDVVVNPEPVTGWQTLVNPYWLANPTELPGTKRNAIWHVATDRYTPASPSDVWEPLLWALTDRDEPVFGEIRLTRYGGAMDMDLFFPEQTVEYDGFEHILGISTGNDYFGGRRLTGEIVALDLNADLRREGAHVIRDLTDPRKRKHTGDAPSVVAAWWGSVLETVETVTETLYGVVTDSMAYEIDIGSLPCTIEQFYEHLGLPNAGVSPIASLAAKRAVQTVDGGYDAFHLHRAAMQALEHSYGSHDTSAYVTHTATVNALLFNPARAEQDVLTSIMDSLDAEETEITELDGVEKIRAWSELSSKRERLRERVETIGEGVEEFKSARARLKKMLIDAEKADASDADAGDEDADEDDSSTDDERTPPEAKEHRASIHEVES